MTFQDLGATGIITIVILAFAVIGFLKGFIRTVLAMVCLGIAGYTALWGNEHASDLTGPWINHPGPWLPKIIAVITGVTVFFICRYALNFLVDPFNRSKTGARIGFGLPAAALSLCSGLAILWLSFTGIRYGGSLAELRYTHHQILKDKTHSDQASDYAIPLLLQAKQSLDASSVGKWHQLTDPFYAPGKVTLCKILVIYHNKFLRLQLLKKPAINALLNHPAFLDLAYRDEIKNQVSSSNYRELFASTPISTFLSKPELMELLQKVDPAELSAMTSQ